MKNGWLPDYKSGAHLTSDPSWWAQPGQLDKMVERLNEFLLS